MIETIYYFLCQAKIEHFLHKKKYKSYKKFSYIKHLC